MYITTFGRSQVVLRTLLIPQPQTTRMSAEQQAYKEVCFAAVAYTDIT